MAESSSSGVKGFVKDAAITAAAATALDFFTEVVGLPYLNDPSPFPLGLDHQQTIIETILTGTGYVLTGLGAFSVFAGKNVIPGFGHEALARGIGILAGTSFYEHQLVKPLGIRNIRHGVYR